MGVVGLLSTQLLHHQLVATPSRAEAVENIKTVVER
jgi:hypothetical protein